MSSGPSCLNAKPRLATSYCMEDAPVSNKTPSTLPGRKPRDGRRRGRSLKRPKRGTILGLNCEMKRYKTVRLKRQVYIACMSYYGLPSQPNMTLTSIGSCGRQVHGRRDLGRAHTQSTPVVSVAMPACDHLLRTSCPQTPKNDVTIIF